MLTKIKKIAKDLYLPYHKRVDYHTKPYLLLYHLVFDSAILIKNYILYFPQIISEFKRTRKFKNAYKRKNAFVFANGPSLRKIDFRKVEKYRRQEGFKLFGVNSFVLLENKVIPDFYVLSDPAFFGDFRYVNEKRKEEIVKTVKILSEQKIPLFVPINFAKIIKKSNIFRQNDIFFFNDFEFLWFNKNVSNILLPRAYQSMTAYKAISIALYMGFEKIYICGFDNNWFKFIEVNKENKIMYINEHFKNQADDGVRIVPSWEAKNLGELLHGFAMLFYDLYKFPRDKIINLDKESLVDAFSKKHNLDIYTDGN